MKKSSCKKINGLALRDPNEVMRFDRMGSSHQTRLSFMRQLLRRISKEKWLFSTPIWEMSDEGFGTAVYDFLVKDRHYSLVAFTHDLPPDKRSDRVIATDWDLTFALFDGIPSEEDIKRLKKNVPLQEAGRLSNKELVLGRANKSTRLWDLVVDSLSRGLQPSLESVHEVGYLMRTTAVYGSGKFGLKDRIFIKDRPELRAPFQAEMLAVYMLRCLVMDLIEFVASKRGGDKARKLNPGLRKFFGIGNSTGLGMAPFLVNHPDLLHSWIKSRELAIARVRAVKIVTDQEKSLFKELLKRVIGIAEYWNSENPLQIKKLKDLKNDLQSIQNFTSGRVRRKSWSWDECYCWARKTLTLEGQEALFSLMLEPYGHLIDGLTSGMAVDDEKYTLIDGTISCQLVKTLVEKEFGWALKNQYQEMQEQARFWYVSEEKLEPRLGERFKEDGSQLELPLAIGRDIKMFYDGLLLANASCKLADFLIDHSEFRHIAKRILQFRDFAYGEIRDNLICANMKPIDLLRFKLSFFGASRFDPRSDRWVRICMYQYAPYPPELAKAYDDFWPYPSLEAR